MRLFSRTRSLIYISAVVILVILLTSENVKESNAIYAYTIKGYVQDLRHQPRLLIGGWALKKALKLKKLKILLALKIKLKLKLLAKRLLFKFLHGRRRRSLEHRLDSYEIDLPDNMIPEIHENDITPYYIMASEFDEQGCLPKSICDVMARNRTRRAADGFSVGGGGDGGRRHEVNPFERMITEDYVDVQRPEDTTAPSFVYEYAAYFGRTAKSERACASLFSTCHEPASKLNKIMDGSYRTDICDSPDEMEYLAQPASLQHLGQQQQQPQHNGVIQHQLQQHHQQQNEQKLRQSILRELAQRYHSQDYREQDDDAPPPPAPVVLRGGGSSSSLTFRE